VEHKKRGRPRIQSERAPQRPLITPAGSYAVQTSVAGEPLRSLHSPAADLGRRGSVPTIGSAVPDYGYSHQQRATAATASIQPPRSEAGWRIDPLFAFLNLDLKFLKVSEPLRVLLGDRQDLTNAALEQFVEFQHREALSRLQTWLRDERHRIEPMYLPRIMSNDQEMHAVQAINEADIDRLTRASREEVDNYAFRLPAGRSETFLCRIRLARTEDLFFATLTMQPLPSSAVPATGYGMRRSLEHPGPRTVMTRDTSFIPPGPSSPYARSAPGSPFSTLPQHLMTTLPPPMSSISAGHVTPEGREGAGGYFGRHLPPAPMHPPPQPHAPSSLSRSRRPEPLGSLLPPLVSNSAPTTPVGAQFNIEQQGPPGSTSSSLGGRSVTTAPGSARRRKLSEEPEDDDEDTGRKRRRLHIGEIIEK
jgi:hypothetical protein